MEFSVHQIARLIEGEVKGEGDLIISGAAKIEEGKPGTIAFLANPRYEQHLYTTKATAVIVNRNLPLKKEVQTTLILVDDAYSAFTQLMHEYQKALQQVKTGVEAQAIVHASATIAATAYIGSFTYIDENCQVADNAQIYPQVYLGKGVQVGAGSILYPGVKVYAGCTIGKNCIVHSGAIIGADGFGFAPQPDGSYKKIPQLGTVIIEDNVEIGANTTVDRAVIDATLVQEGTKLDNLVQIGHNVTVGKHTVIASLAGIAGSAQIGDYNTFGGQVGMAGHIATAAKTTVGPQAGITNSVKKEGQVLLGSPATDIRSAKRSMIVFKQLPEMLKRLKALEEEFKKYTRKQSTH